jgi:cell division protein FtsB
MAEDTELDSGRARPAKRSHLRRSARRPAADAGRSRLGDLTRPIPVERRIVRRRRSTIALGVVALSIAAALAAALFIIPVQTYRDQSETLERRTEQVDQLEAVNAQLRAEVSRLRTEAGTREAARSELGFGEAGEDRLRVLDLPPLPTDLPAGWPYDMITSVIALRTAGG